jgi:hypothetical protein
MYGARSGPTGLRIRNNTNRTISASLYCLSTSWNLASRFSSFERGRNAKDIPLWENIVRYNHQGRALLCQIDVVFVTLEPGGESHKPSGRSLLFAYLKVNSNHP